MARDQESEYLTEQERQLIVEALDVKIQDLVQELQIGKDVSSIYWRSGIKDAVKLHDSGHAKYLHGEIERNVALIKKMLRI